MSNKTNTELIEEAFKEMAGIVGHLTADLNPCSVKELNLIKDNFTALRRATITFLDSDIYKTVQSISKGIDKLSEVLK